MYDNIGGKIKGLAGAVFIVEAIVTILYGLSFMLKYRSLLFGLLCMILGPVLAWISSWVLYGFGELIDNTSDIAQNIFLTARKSSAQSKGDH